MTVSRNSITLCIKRFLLLRKGGTWSSQNLNSPLSKGTSNIIVYNYFDLYTFIVSIKYYMFHLKVASED